MGIAQHGENNQVKGAGKVVEGNDKERHGAATGRLGEEFAGSVEKNVGKAQEKLGRGEKDAAR